MFQQDNKAETTLPFPSFPSLKHTGAAPGEQGRQASMRAFGKGASPFCDQLSVECELDSHNTRVQKGEALRQTPAC
eukprot:1160708-Pelagomonas_calceolata.AAC.1